MTPPVGILPHTVRYELDKTKPIKIYCHSDCLAQIEVDFVNSLFRQTKTIFRGIYLK